MFFAVKHIYLTLYIVHICRVAPIYSVPLYLLALLAVRACWRSLWPSYLRPDRFQPLAVCVAVWPCSLRCSLARLCARCAVHLLAYVLAALASVLYRLGNCYIFNDTSPGLFFTCARCACLCVRLLMPGQRWTFLSVVPVRPALLARVCARCARLRACAWACSLRSPTPVPAPTPTCVPAPVPVCVACLLPLFAPIL